MYCRSIKTLLWDRKLERKQHSLRSARDSLGEGESLGTKVPAVSSNSPSQGQKLLWKPTLENSPFHLLRKQFPPYQNQNLTINPGPDSKTHILTGHCITQIPKTVSRKLFSKSMRESFKRRRKKEREEIGGKDITKAIKIHWEQEIRGGNISIS